MRSAPAHLQLGMCFARAARDDRKFLGRTQFLCAVNYGVGWQGVLQNVDDQIDLSIHEHEIAIDESKLQFLR